MFCCFIVDTSSMREGKKGDTSSLAIAVGLSFAVTTSILVALLCIRERHFL